MIELYYKIKTNKQMKTKFWVSYFKLKLKEIYDIRTVVYGVMGCSRKSFELVSLCHQHLCGFLAKGHLLRVSRQSPMWGSIR